MFVDKITIKVKAGAGGDGGVSFHREKYVAEGGPDGGDGGRGGDVIIHPDPSVNTLIDFRHHRKYAAEPGMNGSGNNKTGKSGSDLVLKVPVGTVVYEASTGAVMADTSDGRDRVIAHGGKGGFGNARFSTPTRQIPMFAKSGKPGEELEITLELKMIADAGLIGFPNVGKSTILSVISAARPKIADYHFTTLEPMLGVVEAGPDSRFVAADIPGLIEGAADGAGLGHDFLRHIERCRVLIHVVDVSGSEGRDPIKDYEQINSELGKYSADLLKKPQIAALNKCDIASKDNIDRMSRYLEEKSVPFVCVSAATGQGIKELISSVWEIVKRTPAPRRFEETYVRPETTSGRDFYVRKEDGKYFVDAEWLERIISKMNPDDYHSMQYFQNAVQTSGIDSKLRELGIKDGDTVCVGDYEFNYVS
ncbi:MAG: GTPase ObgE [Oscillospiraceae bacterium]|jgi:GTP-binding protein